VEAPEFDRVSKTKHYNSHPSGVEVKEVTSFLSFNLGNCFKYVVRHDVEEQENPLRSLQSALWYLKEYWKERSEAPKPQFHTSQRVAGHVARFAEFEPDPLRKKFFQEFFSLVQFPYSKLAFETTSSAVQDLINRLKSA
jgi:hypothetical protein